jgi:hypothetical protein
MSHSLVQQNGASNGFTHSAVCLTKGAQLLPKRVLHTVRPNVFSFGFQNTRVSLTASSSCLRLLPRLPVTSILPWQWKIQKDATVYQNFITPYFKWSSTCFGRHTAPPQEQKNAQTATGCAYVEGCRTCSCGTLSSRYATWQLPPTTRPTTFQVCKTRGCLCSFRLLMMGSVSPETCWALFKIRNNKILIHCCILLGFSVRILLRCTDPRTLKFIMSVTSRQNHAAVCIPKD